MSGRKPSEPARSEAQPSEVEKAGPLAGVRILAIEQMQAMPFASQLLANLGAEVVHVGGNPIKLSGSPDPPAARWPRLGEHTDEILARDLGLDAAARDGLRAAGVIS